MAFDFTRRHFFFGSLLAGAVPSAGFGSTPSLKALGYKSPNEKLNIASIGAGGKAASDIAGCAPTENIVALCDVDEVRAKAVFNRYEKLPKYKDFRKMLDKEGDGIDAVIIAIPDHMHATAAMHCMSRGKHVYTQKPLCRTIWEARQLQEAANRFKVATQMGNQGYSNEGTRQCAEMIWSGAIGDVKEVHAWTDRPWWPQGVTEIPPADAVPSTLDWDMWLGMAAPRDFTSGGAAYEHNQYGHFYQPFNWRGFFDFGCGALGDMACHILGAPNLSLRLGTPTSVEAIKKEGTSPFQFPKASVIKFDFPARGNMPPVTLYWHDGLKDQPKIQGVPENEYLGDLPRIGNAGRGGRGGRGANGQPLPPPEPTGFIGDVFKFNEAYLPSEERRHVSPDGSLFIGDKGLITTGTYGEDTRLLPVEKMRDYRFPPPLLTRSPGHYRDWIRACKGGDPACSNFNVAAPFVEWMLLGVIALRAEGKIEYDPAKMRITNNAEANQYLKPFIRKGWNFAG
ncbi:MAG: Gfo/Idh/MocA family oxidoreductase [Acidobacteriota bacterium]|nr:Gfo/Idh/MocA family oxidoreductase [Acidobacteriota bacterium]